MVFVLQVEALRFCSCFMWGLVVKDHLQLWVCFFWVLLRNKFVFYVEGLDVEMVHRG